MATITKELAIKIAKKLGAEIQNRGGAHDLAKVYYKGKLIAHFGIRRCPIPSEALHSARES